MMHPSFALRLLFGSAKASLSMTLSLLVVSPAIAQAPSISNRSLVAVQASSSDDYLLGAGDRVRIDFFGVPEFTGEYQVLPNGAINLPFAGAIPVQGLTLGRATKLIETRFKPFLARPAIAISLLAARPITVTIAGEVNRPGSYTVSALPTSGLSGDVTTPSLTRTIQLAEGVTQSADLKQVQIRRQRPDTPGMLEVVTVDLWKLLQTGDNSQDVRLRDGDSIFIPASTAIDLEASRQLAAANFATKGNRSLKIVVVGEVSRPGPYTISDGATTRGEQRVGTTAQVPSVTQAIQVAGGITQMADIRNIQVRRLTRLGTEQVVKVNFWNLLKSGDIRQDLALQDGDTVEIPTASTPNDREITELGAASFAPDKITVNIVGEVEKPGAVIVPPNTPLNQAILTAGGFNQKARKREVTLLRLNPNGSVTKRDVSIDFEQGVNDKTNPALRNNDIVIVKKAGFYQVTDTVNSVLTPFSSFFGFIRLFGF